MKQPTAWTGALVGALLTAPLIAIFYLGWRFIGLPFVPFDVFDWLTRMLPGSVITFTIDSMVKIIRSLNIGSTAGVAKLTEQSMAILIFFIAGSVVSALLFIAYPNQRKRASILGWIVGAIVGLLVTLITRHSGEAGMIVTVMGVIWMLAAFIAWGAVDASIYNRLPLVPPVVPAVATDAEERSVTRIDRRKFLIRLGAASATITVAGAALGALVGRKHAAEVSEAQRWSASHALPNATAAVVPAPGTRPEFTPLDQHYRIDINTMPPVIDEQTWRLRVGGLVDRPSIITLEDIRRREPMHQFITLACISNPVAGDLTSTTRWTGASMKQLLPEWKLKSNATHLKITAADGFFETVALETINDDERVMLAYAWDGVPLQAKHGFPLRIYIPDRYGMKQPKWIEAIDAIGEWEAGYWVVRGWDQEARMKATSVIDTIAVEETTTDASGHRMVPVGGIAHAGARGISKVEVQIDSGEWREAQLRTPLSDLTWVIWRFEMPFQSGEHTLTVRCTDGKGASQIIEPAPPHPSGASGLDSKIASEG